MATETFPEMLTEERDAHSCIECYKTFKNSRGLQRFSHQTQQKYRHVFCYEFILIYLSPISKLKDPIQTSKEKNQINKYVTRNPRTTKRTRILNSEAYNTSHHANMVDDHFLAY